MGRNSRKDHDAMRKSVCYFCLDPASRRHITSATAEKVKQLHPDFDLENPLVPLGICSTCYNKLHREPGVDFRKPNYPALLSSSQPPKPGKENFCECYICIAGKVKLGRNKLAKPKAAPAKMTCNTCYLRYSPDDPPHKCLLGNRVDNILEWLPKNVSQQVASSVISKNVDLSSGSPLASLHRKKGPKMQVDLTPPSKRKQSGRQLKFAEIDRFKSKLKLSGRKTMMFNQGYRVLNGRKSIASGYKQHVTDRTNEEAQFLTQTEITLEGDIHKTVIHAEHLQDYFERVKLKRGINHNNVLLKLCGDLGGDLFKLNMQVIDLNKLDKELAKKRHLWLRARNGYKDGLFPTEFSDNSVERLFFVAAVKTAKENYELVASVFDLVDFTGLKGFKKFGITGDQKFINIITGKGNHASTFPCSWCWWKRFFPAGAEIHLATVGDLRADYEAFAASAARGEKTEAADHHNVIRRPLIPAADDVKVLSVVFPCELHYLLRSFNHIWDALRKEWSGAMNTTEDLGTRFAISVGAVPEKYHGGHGFTGGKCRQLLNSLDKLAPVLPPSLHYFLTVLQNLSDVVGSCFGVAAPPPNYVDIIGKFAASVRQHEDTISFTPTLHAIEKHIIEFFEAEGNFIGIVTQFNLF